MGQSHSCDHHGFVLLCVLGPQPLQTPDPHFNHSVSFFKHLHNNHHLLIHSLALEYLFLFLVSFYIFFESYVRHEHPLWSDDQVDSKASFYKSFLDGTSCVVSLFMLPILGILPSSLPTLSRTISFPFSLFFISVIYLILYQVVSLIYLEERR